MYSIERMAARVGLAEAELRKAVLSRHTTPYSSPWPQVERSMLDYITAVNRYMEAVDKADHG